MDAQQPAHRYAASDCLTGRVKPDAFAAVMATGIVSIAARDHGWDVVSSVLAVIAAVLLPVLMVPIFAPASVRSPDTVSGSA